MANLKASKKDIPRSRARATRNRAVRSKLRTLSRKFTLAREQQDAEATASIGRELVSAYDKAAKRNVVHPNRVSTLKAKVSKYLG